MLSKLEAANLLSLIESYVEDSINAELLLKEQDAEAHSVAQAMLTLTRSRVVRYLAELTETPTHENVIHRKGQP